MSRSLAAFVLLLSLFGCSQPRTESPTKGRLVLLATESLAPIVQKEAEEFHRLYPEATATVLPTSSRDAVVQLLSDSVRLIVIDRPLNTEELQIAQQYDIDIATNRLAEDALAVITQIRNPIEKISLSSLEKILRAKAVDWRQVPEAGWSGRIQVALTGRNSGVYELLVNGFFEIQDHLAVHAVAETQRAVLEYVAAHAGALGIVSASAIHDTAGQPELQRLRASIRVLSVSGKDSATANTFVKLHQANVYRKLYPLHYPVFLHTSASNTSVAAGFAAFVASVPGQKIFQNAGLVPATMPVRLVQITQEQLPK